MLASDSGSCTTNSRTMGRAVARGHLLASLAEAGDMTERLQQRGEGTSREIHIILEPIYYPLMLLTHFKIADKTCCHSRGAGLAVFHGLCPSNLCRPPLHVQSALSSPPG